MIPTARDFLTHLYYDVPAGNFFELTLILPPELADVGPSPITKSYEIGQQRVNWDYVADMNARGYGVYYALTASKRRPIPGKRRRESDASWLTCLWVDIDLDDGLYPDADSALAALQAFPLFATAIIASGGGFHALWRLRALPVDPDVTRQAKATMQGLAQYLKADPHCHDLARVFRLPGSVNTKPKRHGARCELVDWLPGEWTLDDFAEFAVESRPVDRPHFDPPSEPLNLPRWVTDYLEAGAAKGSRNARLYAATIEYRANGYSWGDAARDLISRAQADGLGDREIESTMRSAWESGKGEPNLGRGNHWRGG